MPKHLKNTLICLPVWEGDWTGAFFFFLDRSIFIPSKLSFTRTGCGQTLQTNRDRENRANMSNFLKAVSRGFPGGSEVKNPPANTGPILGPGRPHTPQQPSPGVTAALEPWSLPGWAHVPGAPAQHEKPVKGRPHTTPRAAPAWHRWRMPSRPWRPSTGGVNT